MFWQPLKAQTVSFPIDYDGYTLEYTVIQTNPPCVSVKCSDPDDSELTIPAIVTHEETNYSVTEIADYGFDGMMDFYGSLTIPNTITKIGNYAFSGCDGFDGITIPEGVITIGDNAFSNCTSFTGALTIPNSVTSIGDYAFFNCINFTGALTIPNSVTSIGDYAFYNCINFKGALTIPNSVISIGANAFESCTKITEVTISENVKEIPQMCFRGCSRLKTITIPDNVTYIGNQAFYGCRKISNLKFPKKLKSIGASAFSGCEEVSTIIIPKEVTNIGDECFSNCEYLNKITITTSEVPNLGGKKVFESTSDTLEIYIPANLYDGYMSDSNWYSYKDRIVTLPTFINNGEWSTSSNWSSSTLPASTDDVFINAEAIIGPEDIATVKSYSICGNGSITIEDGGQLIHNEGYGEVTMKKKIEAYVLGEDDYLESGWYTISSAFGEMPINNNNLLVSNYELFRYNETIYEWENVKNSENDFTTLELGRGYIYSNEEATTLSLTGEPYTENVTYNLTAEGELLNGFNLVGNPFTHNIYKGSGASLYNANLADGYYMLTNAGAWLSKLDSEPILPAQGILVKTSAAGSLNINKTTASATRRAASNGLLTIKVSNEKYEDVAYVTFNGGTGLDKIEHRNKNIPMIYVHDSGSDYAIAVMKKDVKEIPIHFEHKTLGKYTISVSANDFECKELLLLDNYNGDCVNILEEDYTFLAMADIAPNRFTLKIIPKEDEIVIYTNDNDIVIENISGDAMVNVYDVSGRIVTKTHSNSNIKISSNTLSKGIYIVNVTDEKESKTQKVVVK